MLLDDEVQSESISFCPIHFKPNLVLSHDVFHKWRISLPDAFTYLLIDTRIFMRIKMSNESTYLYYGLLITVFDEMYHYFFNEVAFCGRTMLIWWHAPVTFTCALDVVYLIKWKDYGRWNDIEWYLEALQHLQFRVYVLMKHSGSCTQFNEAMVWGLFRIIMLQHDTYQCIRD